MPDQPVSAENAKLYLRDIEPMWRAFWLHMHLVAKNLKEFGEGLATISDDVFAYHVSGQKNDLAKWVQEVVGDSVLAARLSAVSSQREAAEAVRDRVADLERAAAAGGTLSLPKGD
jgi:hypothetical protein